MLKVRARPLLVIPLTRWPAMCPTGPMFPTTAEFLPCHREHHQQVLRIISAAEARGHERVAEMNRQVAANLDKIITALAIEAGAQEAAGAR